MKERYLDIYKSYSTTTYIKQIIFIASALLMPEFMMKDYLTRNGRENGIFLYDDNFIRPEDNFILQRMASDMKVSNSALLIRISQLQLYERRPIDEYISELGLESGVPC